MPISQLQRDSGANIRGARAMRSFLVVVRAGDQSFHKRWMKKGEPRQWDLLVDCYGQTPDYHDEFADFTTSGGVAKFPSLAAIDTANPGFLRAYEAVFLPDDDLELDFADLDRLFEFFMNHGLLLAQPSLSHDSYYSMPICRHCALFDLRFTNFVEIMAPMFSRAALATCIATFGESVSGFGLDVVWPKLLGDPDDRIGIIDAVQMRHARKIDMVAGPFYRYLQSLGIDPHQELKAVTHRHGIDFHNWRFRIYGGIPSQHSLPASFRQTAMPSYLASVAGVFSAYFDGTNVLELGTLASGVRDHLGQVREFIGADLIPGPGVDHVGPLHEIALGREFDVVLSTHFFEHDQHCVGTFERMVRHARPGGLVVFSCASTGHPRHGTVDTRPADSFATNAMGWHFYRNVTVDEFHNFRFADHFAEWRFFNDCAACELHFVGIKKSTDLQNSSEALEKIGAQVMSRQTDVSRMALCPCGSGKRYKHCHGRY
jgi:SEC-C motif/Protein of unknown function (DUF707)